MKLAQRSEQMNTCPCLLFFALLWASETLIKHATIILPKKKRIIKIF